MTTRRPTRLLTFAAGVLMMAGARGAAAQTVIVRNAGPGVSVELTLNGNRIAPSTAAAPTANPADAVFPLDVLTTLNKAQTDVRFFVDSCGGVRRVYVEEAGRQPSNPPGACVRRAIPDLYVVQAISTIVLDLAGDNASALIKQGPAPPEWLGLAETGTTAEHMPAPTGLVVSAGIGLGTFAELLTHSCGNAPRCGSDSGRLLSSAGATYWFGPHFAADLGYIRPVQVQINGGGDGYDFDTTVDFRIATMALRVGGQAGPVRITGLGGATFQESLFTTSETVRDTATTTAGQLTISYRTRGWGWFGGGSVEGWVSRWVALYGEGGWLAGRGSSIDGESEFDDSMAFGIVGVRLHIGR